MQSVSDVQLNDADVQRAEELFQQQVRARHGSADRMFAVLMIAQWIFGVILALLVSPYAWAGKVREFHPHLYAAVFMGAGGRRRPPASHVNDEFILRIGKNRIPDAAALPDYSVGGFEK